MKSKGSPYTSPNKERATSSGTKIQNAEDFTSNTNTTAMACTNAGMSVDEHGCRLAPTVVRDELDADAGCGVVQEGAVHEVLQAPRGRLVVQVHIKEERVGVLPPCLAVHLQGSGGSHGHRRRLSHGRPNRHGLHNAPGLQLPPQSAVHARYMPRH